MASTRSTVLPNRAPRQRGCGPPSRARRSPPHAGASKSTAVTAGGPIRVVGVADADAPLYREEIFIACSLDCPNDRTAACGSPDHWRSQLSQAEAAARRPVAVAVHGGGYIHDVTIPPRLIAAVTSVALRTAAWCALRIYLTGATIEHVNSDETTAAAKRAVMISALMFVLPLSTVFRGGWAPALR